MAKTVKQLKEERGQKLKEQKGLLDTRNNEKREFTDEEVTNFNTLDDEIKALDTQIAQRQREEEAAKRHANLSGTPLSDKPAEELDKIQKRFSFTKALRSAVDPNIKLEGVELEMHQEAGTEFQRSGVSGVGSGGSVLIPEKLLRQTTMGFEKRDLTAEGQTSVAGDQGGVTVQTSVSGYIEALQARSVLLRKGADYMTGLTGNFTMSKENSVYSPSWEGETDQNAEKSPTFSKVTFAPERLGGFIDVSKQLMMQSSESIERRLRNQINRGQALAIDLGGINGSGSNDQPTGILNDSGVGVVAIGDNGGAITDALTLSLEEKIDLANANFGNIGFITTPGLKKAMKQIKLDDGSGMFLWDRQTNTVQGYMAEATTQMPNNLTKGTSSGVCHAAILANFEGCAFGQWGGLEILVDQYTQATYGMIRLVINQYVDFHVLQGGMFAVIKDATIS